MSIKVSKLVFKAAEPKGAARLVLLALANYADDNGKCWPSIPTIARDAGISERWVQRNLRQLEHEGYICTTARPQKRENNLSNVFHISISKLQTECTITNESALDSESTLTTDVTYYTETLELGNLTSNTSDHQHNPSVNCTPPSGELQATPSVNYTPPSGELQTTPSVAHSSPESLSESSGIHQEEKSTTTTQRNKKFSRIIKTYEREIGSLTGYISQEIDNMLDDYPEDWIMSAFREAALHNKRNFAYVKAILKRYKEEGKNTTAPKTRQVANSGHPNQLKKSNQDGFAAAENRSLRNLEEIISKGEINEHLM